MNQRAQGDEMTSKKREHCVVATYDSHARVEAAVNELQQSGLEMRRVSIVGKDFHANEDARDRKSVV